MRQATGVERNNLFDSLEDDEVPLIVFGLKAVFQRLDRLFSQAKGKCGAVIEDEVYRHTPCFGLKGLGAWGFSGGAERQRFSLFSL